MPATLPVPAEPLALARSHTAARHLCFLDTARGGGQSFVMADPVAVYRCKDGEGVLTWADGRSEKLTGDPFTDPAAVLREHSTLTAAGYWSYDARYHVERLPRRTLDDLRLPDCWLGYYADTFRYDRTECPAKPPRRALPVSTPEPRDTMPRAAYEGAAQRVLEYIAAGDCYQVNLSHRLTVPLTGEPWGLYERLRGISPAPYAAYLDCGDHQVLSASPELFLRIRDGQVETRPIKGTRPRGRTPEEDAALAAELLSSAKDRAELLMIVDLERNDLGRVCEYGSVHVPDLFRLESYSNVHHLVATVRGTVRPELGPLDCLRAAFPGGSITGAPKIRAMEIIEELEPVRRGVYTGAIGWMDGRGNAEWNIAIRTMVAQAGQVHLYAGGGIVADSDPAAEFDETMVKAEAMLRATRRV